MYEFILGVSAIIILIGAFIALNKAIDMIFDND